MFRPRNVICLLLAAGVSACQAASADHVVLISEASDYAVGDILAEPLTLRLDEGQRVVLLSDRGDVFDVSGPFEGEPEGHQAENFNLRDALAGLIDNPDRVQARLGSTRSFTSRIGATSGAPAWQLDPFRSGAQCAVAGRQPVFWRGDTEQALSLLLQRPGVDGGSTISWRAGEAESPWPDEMPAIDGELYVVRREGYVDSTMFSLALIPPGVLQETASSIAWLAANGCRRQAEMLMDSMPE